MGSIDNGYDQVWDKLPQVARELKSFKSSLDNQDFVTKAIFYMLEAWTASVLPFGVSPTVASLLGLVCIPHSDKLRIIINMTCVNEHFVKRVVFKFEGLSGIADMAGK
jgi:hypothetical protein